MTPLEQAIQGQSEIDMELVKDIRYCIVIIVK